MNAKWKQILSRNWSYKEDRDQISYYAAIGWHLSCIRHCV
jgi:hypothetical protein